MPGAPDDLREREFRARLEAQRQEFQKVVDAANAALRAIREEFKLEWGRREGAERELENLKKGSVAMMKYVTNLQRKKHDEELEALRSEGDAKSSPFESIADARAELREQAKETADLEAYIAEQYALLERARKGEKGTEALMLEKREKAMALREAQLEKRRKDLDEQFQRLKEERELRRAESQEGFTNHMNALPEMEKLIVERDDKIKELARRNEDLEDEVRRLKAVEGLTLDSLGMTSAGEEVLLRMKVWDDEVVRLRHRLVERDEELKALKADFEKKMRNTIGLQRIAYEKRIEELLKAKGARRSPFGRKGRR